MFGLLKLIIWLAGIIVIAYFVLGYFGYEVNRQYFDESKEKCQEALKQCSNKIFRDGIDNAKCDYNCVDPKIIIKKKQ
jgi:hypothetical protein